MKHHTDQDLRDIITSLKQQIANDESLLASVLAYPTAYEFSADDVRAFLKQERKNLRDYEDELRRRGG